MLRLVIQINWHLLINIAKIISIRFVKFIFENNNIKIFVMKFSFIFRVKVIVIVGGNNCKLLLEAGASRTCRP